MKRKVIITGSNGLLGQKLVPLLAKERDIEVIATARGINRNPNKAGYLFESLDITDQDALAAAFAKHQPTDFINTAAMTNVDQCEKDQTEAWELNSVAVGSMARLCKTYQTRLIHLSTDFIFDGKNGPYLEADIPNPISWYGKTKLGGEMEVFASGARYAVARVMLIYGLVADMSRSNIVLWAKNSLENGNKINVVNDQVRCPTLSEDLAEGIRLILLKDAEGVYHLSGPESMNMVELVHRVARFWNLEESLIGEIDSETLGQAAQRPPVTGFNISKAKKDLGYNPGNFEAGLKVVDAQLRAFAG